MARDVLPTPDALADRLPRCPLWQGTLTVYRCVADGQGVLDTRASRQSDGRWHRAEATGALYFSSHPDLCVREERPRPGARYVVAEARVQVARLLDLTDPTVLGVLGIGADLAADGAEPFDQVLGMLARRRGAQALRVPAAAGEGWNLVVYEPLPPIALGATRTLIA